MDPAVQHALQKSGRLVVQSDGMTSYVGFSFVFCDAEDEVNNDAELHSGGQSLGTIFNGDDLSGADIGVPAVANVRRDQMYADISQAFEGTGYDIDSVTWNNGNIEFSIVQRDGYGEGDDQAFDEPHEVVSAIETMENALGVEFPRDENGGYVIEQLGDATPDPQCEVLWSDVVPASPFKLG